MGLYHQACSTLKTVTNGITVTNTVTIFAIVMINFFNPGNPKYCRGVYLLSVYCCTLAGMHAVMIDFGPKDHCFTPIQKYVNKKVDEFYQITPDELANKSNANTKSKWAVSIRTVQVDNNKH